MKRSPIILIGLVVVVAAIVLLLLPSGEREASEKPSAVGLKIDSASINRIELRRPSQSVVLDNVGGRWMVSAGGRYTADPTVISRFISDLSRMKVGSQISTNPEKQHLFQVDSTGTFVTVTDRSGKMTQFILGKMGPSFTEVYFRMPDSKDVYLAEGMDSWSVNRDVREWRDKTILLVPAESVKELTYTIGGKQYAFQRDSSGWKSGDRTVESSVISPPLSTLSMLRADDFLDDGVTEKTAPITIAVHWIETTTLMLYPRLPDSSKYVVQSSTSSQLFVISKWTAQNLLKPVQQGVSAPAPVIAAAAPPKAKTQVKTAPVKSPPTVHAQPVTKTQPVQQPVVQHQVPVKKQGRETVTKPAPDQGNSAPKPVEQKPVEKQPLEQKPVEKQPAEQKPVQTPSKPVQAPVKQSDTPASKPATVKPTPAVSADEGDLQVHTVAKGETMQTIAKKYNVNVEQILKWNLLKSIVVKPGQELYIYVKK
jgi:hypothetical protein